MRKIIIENIVDIITDVCWFTGTASLLVGFMFTAEVQFSSCTGFMFFAVLAYIWGAVNLVLAYFMQHQY